MNALHLENYGVSALETREMRETDGGAIPILLIAFGAGFTTGFAAGVAMGIAKWYK